MFVSILNFPRIQRIAPGSLTDILIDQNYELWEGNFMINDCGVSGGTSQPGSSLIWDSPGVIVVLGESYKVLVQYKYDWNTC